MPSTKGEKHRSFTIRVPESLYVQLCDMAQEEKSFLSAKVNELILLGLKQNANVEQALLRLLKREMIEDDGN